MKGNRTCYYVFSTGGENPKYHGQFRTLAKARRVYERCEKGCIQKNRKTPSKHYFGHWFPKKERLTPTTTLRKLYRKLYRVQAEQKRIERSRA